MMTHVTCRLTAKNRDQLRNPTLGNRVWATFTFLAASHSESRCIDAPYDVNLVLVLLGDRGCDDFNGL